MSLRLIWHAGWAIRMHRDSSALYLPLEIWCRRGQLARPFGAIDTHRLLCRLSLAPCGRGWGEGCLPAPFSAVSERLGLRYLSLLPLLPLSVSPFPSQHPPRPLRGIPFLAFSESLSPNSELAKRSSNAVLFKGALRPLFKRQRSSSPSAALQPPALSISARDMSFSNAKLETSNARRPFWSAHRGITA
jgi:hypothetical protein